MMACTPISTCSKKVVCLIGSFQRQPIIRASYASRQSSCYYYSSGKHPRLHFSPTNGFNCHELTFKRLIRPRQHSNTRVNVSTGNGDMNFRLFVPKQSSNSKIKCNVGPFYLNQRTLYSGVFMGLLVCFSASQPSYAEAPEGNQKKEGYCDAYSGGHSHNKKVLTDYSVIGIPGDGRCLFRSVAHGACVRAGKPAPNENLQRELADELRARVADEFIKRREETEWFIEGDFETYVSKIRRPHVWGGEPELLMASHVLQMPITVYMHDQESGGLISIAEYGQEYGKDNPIKVLYHGYGHYDALHIPGKVGSRPRL
ncbi:OTU-like cysteine protease family protein [Striga asiatica]|uniref:Ubiquitin thioesterase OTU n=1 Tax=Striga asiatica TaxID=4170 RepID=A0A5A7Q4S4_STRAF|nr:OTU-like cysteine protease family protein [Striga asiatica]